MQKQENANSPTNKSDETSDTRLQFSDGITLELAKLNLDALLTKVGSYGFPIFELAARSPRTLLTELAYKIFRDADLFRVFKIPYRQFFSFFHSLELGYWEIPCKQKLCKNEA